MGCGIDSAEAVFPAGELQHEEAAPIIGALGLPGSLSRTAHGGASLFLVSLFDHACW